MSSADIKLVTSCLDRPCCHHDCDFLSLVTDAVFLKRGLKASRGIKESKYLVSVTIKRPPDSIDAAGTPGITGIVDTK